jgi:hypothetical protein
MKQRKRLAGVAVSHAFNLIVAGGLSMGSSDNIQAAEKKNLHQSAIYRLLQSNGGCIVGIR